ncbi:hypothetical protein AK830_g4609 [Neonectria ditissima]|uniref:Uncharacterized protein n=1 Tax=Neonectria ditissima TaxID=78410 RepID=A0A0P7AVD9_9HYPO|nr:hypothetical protein AK830_g4609 [Neonectria ditissima]
MAVSRADETQDQEQRNSPGSDDETAQKSGAEPSLEVSKPRRKSKKATKVAEPTSADEDDAAAKKARKKKRRTDLAKKSARGMDSKRQMDPPDFLFNDAQKQPAPQPPSKAGKGGGKSDALSLRLDLNLEIEIQLKAKIHGDLTLTLL